MGRRVQKVFLRGKSGIWISCSSTVDLPELSSPMTTILGGVRLPSDFSSPRSGSRILNIRVRSDVMSDISRGECAGGGTILVGVDSATERPPPDRYCCRPWASHEIISGSSSWL